MIEETFSPPPLALAEPGQSWGQLAARFPESGQWPIIGAASCHRDRPWMRHTLWNDDPPPPALTIREQFGLDRRLGWSGAVNAGMLGADAAVVLESWQRRFGAYVCAAYGATLELKVARPPTTVEEARLLAREHFHFCRYDDQFHGIGGIGPYVDRLVGSHTWRF